MSVLPAYRMDALLSRAAAANSRAFNGSQKRYMRALHITKSTASRHFAGENAPSLQFLAYIAAADKATAFPYLCEAWGVVNQNQIKNATTDQLLARLREIDGLEAAADGDEDLKRLRAAENPNPEQRRESARADRLVAELSIERAEIQDELALRDE